MPDAAPEAVPDFTARRSVRTALLATTGVSMLAGLYAALLLVVDREPTAAQGRFGKGRRDAKQIQHKAGRHKAGRHKAD